MTAGALLQSPLVTRRERLWPVVLVSAAVHAGAIAFAFLYQPAPRVDLSQKPIVAKLVRLGEKRPEQWLPRKEEAPPAPAAAPEPAPAPPQAAEPPKTVPPAAPMAAPVRPTPGPRARVRGPTAGGTDVLSSVLSRVKREQSLSEPQWGDPDGDPRGDSAEGAGDQYLALVERSLRESYVLPATLSDADRVRLQATVVLYIEPDGRVARFAFEKRSGSPAFDDALERAIRAARLPPPPAELRGRYRSEGLGVVYRP